VPGVLLRWEFDLARVESCLPITGPEPKGENDWCRAWPVSIGGESGDEMRVDFGLSRPLNGDIIGEGEGESRVKGLLRHRGPF
jgi:hypothetical protein